MRRQLDEEAELDRRQRHLALADAEAARAEIEHGVAEDAPRVVGIDHRLGRGGATQHGADASDELARVERLGDVVVGAHLEADDAVDRIAARRQHDHRQPRRALAQRAEDFDAAHVGQHQVEQDEVGRVAFGGRRGDAVGAARRVRQRDALALEQPDEQSRQLDVVVDEQDRGRDGGRHVCVDEREAWRNVAARPAPSKAVDPCVSNDTTDNKRHLPRVGAGHDAGVDRQ